MPKNENRPKTHVKVAKNEIFGESLPYKSGLGFFVPALEVPFFAPQNYHFCQKCPSDRDPKVCIMRVIALRFKAFENLGEGLLKYTI